MFEKSLRKYVNMYVLTLVDDLMKIVHVLKHNNLIKGNVSRYTYYIIS